MVNRTSSFLAMLVTQLHNKYHLDGEISTKNDTKASNTENQILSTALEWSII